MANLRMQRNSAHHLWQLVMLSLFFALLASGCADQVSSTSHPHPEGYATTHGADANSDLDSCRLCHGSDFSGRGTCPSCLACHVEGPPFGIHPVTWSDVVVDHQLFPQTQSWTTCAVSACHGGELRGGVAGSSCFAAQCHAAGPPAPHASPYTDPADHGSTARLSQIFCRNCHGLPSNNFSGGFVSDPAILNRPSGTCSALDCHPAAKAHPTNWQGTNEDKDPFYDSSHRPVSWDTVDSNCALCHKTEALGTGPMPTAPSCFSTTFTNADGSTTSCHSNGPVPHVIPFTNPALHGPDAKADFNACGQCHAVPFGGGAGSNPRFNVPVGSLGRGCEDCHDERTAHPVPWFGIASNSHKTAGNPAVNCALCHGAQLQGFSEGGVGPACIACHTAGSPLNLFDCSSCHNNPPDGAPPSGNTRPNREGSHNEHNGLPNITGACIACHDGSGSDTVEHFDGSEPTNVSILSSFDSKSGTAEYDTVSWTCSNVSCHGGQTTPDWLTGDLDVNTECAACHQLGTAEFNSYNSGKHEVHVLTEGISCTACHDTTKLGTSHFVGLDTPAFEGNPAETIRNDVNYDLSTCGAGSVGSCHGRGQGSWD